MTSPFAALAPVPAEVNAARELVTYPHIYGPSLELAVASRIVARYDSELVEARLRYMSETEALLEGLDAFTQAYVTSALWTGVEHMDGDVRGDSDKNYDLDPSDLTPDTLRSMIADCERFQRENAETLAAAIATGEVTCGPDFDEMGRAGHDFWLTRNGHGAGFWDGDWPEPYGDTLTKAAKGFGEFDLYMGDDGGVYG